jgi:hypothetical protein
MQDCFSQEDINYITQKIFSELGDLGHDAVS